MIVKDSMVLIHLAKITLLENSCTYFSKVMIPIKVYDEVTANKMFEEVKLIEELIVNKKIQVIEKLNSKYIEKAEEFNIQKGEAEAVALYWQEEADYLATDDDNVRKKNELLNIKIIGTPTIIYQLYKEKIINKDKFVHSINKLRKIGWFSNSVLDRVSMEAR